ncbi:hypothetical protein K7566_13900 [Stenotrophomonas maltophilia]|uniref:hypothetical protein n=1 Tax=Stenotrophomonas maltophilia TaxID=40324 RepID=UPI0011802F31|nr:hypothetical protein [Stenotrophomonas maltophilia]UXB18704.1 hypothetical protein K7566_13900 [Stenotrophomonas maltophilia]
MSDLVKTPTIHDWILSELDIFERSPPANYLSAALQIAVFHLLRSGISNNVDEESFTAALLGSFCESCQVCVAGMPPTSNSSLTWRRHNKSSKGTLGESATGADFALIIRHSNDFARAAVFQAKNGQSDVGSFTADHLSPATKHYPSEQQFVRLRRYCLRILADIKKLEEASLDLKNIGWAHYLIYENSAVYCSPLSSLTILNDRINKNQSPGTVRYKEHPYSNFVDILRDGCSQEPGVQLGWLSLESPSEISAFVDSTEDLYDIYEAHVAPTMDWVPLIEGREILSNQETILLIKEGLLLPSSTPAGQALAHEPKSATSPTSHASEQKIEFETQEGRRLRKALELEKNGNKFEVKTSSGGKPKPP